MPLNPTDSTGSSIAHYPDNQSNYSQDQRTTIPATTIKGSPIIYGKSSSIDQVVLAVTTLLFTQSKHTEQKLHYGKRNLDLTTMTDFTLVLIMDQHVSDHDITAPGSPYLDFLNSSFSTTYDLNLSERVIENVDNSPYPSAGGNGSSVSAVTPRDRILNTFFKRGSKETLSTAGSASPKISNNINHNSSASKTSPQPSFRRHANTNATATSEKASEGSLSPSLSSSTSPVSSAPRSILKQKAVQATTTPTPTANPVPAIPTGPRLVQQQPFYPQDAHRQFLLSNNSDANNNSITSNSNYNYNYDDNNTHQNHHQQQHLQSAVLQPLEHQQPLYSAPFPEQTYQHPHPLGGEFNARPASPFAAAASGRPSSPMRSESPSFGTGGGRLTATTTSGGGYEGNTASLSSTHRSSRQLGSGMGIDPNYNLTESDMTLEGLAERWRSYQALMSKRYSEEPFYKRWTRSKWMLLFSAILMLAYSAALLTVSVGFLLG
ncbi:hypothetical protein BG004_000711, partial [Podila humilis]